MSKKILDVLLEENETDNKRPIAKFLHSSFPRTPFEVNKEENVTSNLLTSNFNKKRNEFSTYLRKEFVCIRGRFTGYIRFGIIDECHALLPKYQISLTNSIGEIIPESSKVWATANQFDKDTDYIITCRHYPR